MNGEWRTLKRTGVRFSEEPGVLTVSQSPAMFGALVFGLALFSSYILFFRPDIHGEVTPLIWIFRVVFPFGFGLMGLLMLGSGTRAEFRFADGTFTHTERFLFSAQRRQGKFAEVKAVTLTVRQESVSERGNTERTYWMWQNDLAMTVDDRPLPIASWTCRIEPKRPQNEGAVEANAIAERLAQIIGCPLVFLPPEGEAGSSRAAHLPPNPG